MIIVFFVVVTGMAAIDLVIIHAQQRMMVENRIQIAKAAIPTLKSLYSQMPSEITAADTVLLRQTLTDHRISCVYSSESSLEKGDAFGTDCTETEEVISQATGNHTNPVYLGRTWGVFWLQPQKALINVSLGTDTERDRQTVVEVDLTPVYSKLRQVHGYLLLYMLINMVCLTFIGSLRIWQIAGRPIQKLAQRVDEYRFSDTMMFQSSPEYGNDISRLSRSLNQMVHRIEADRHSLQESVASLEKANEELRRAQSDIIRAEKLASVGRLAAGIAHEIGNPLGIVTGYLELLKEKSIDSQKRSEFIQRADAELNRINIIIRQLLDFSRPTQEDIDAPLSIHRVIEDVADLLSAQPVMADIDIGLNLNAEHDCVIANFQRMRQVFLNLILNAADALNEVQIETGRHIAISTQSCLSAGIEPSNYGEIVIEVADNGPGIDAANMPNLFDPFFTTKEPGKGTGLGLSVCYMIVDSIGGVIEAANRSSGGTALTLRLPMVETEKTK